MPDDWFHGEETMLSRHAEKQRAREADLIGGTLVLVNTRLPFPSPDLGGLLCLFSVSVFSPLK